ncbi:hypothetical protein ACWD6L_25050, partial [Micromonospora profundi]
ESGQDDGDERRAAHPSLRENRDTWIQRASPGSRGRGNSGPGGIVDPRTGRAGAADNSGDTGGRMTTGETAAQARGPGT